jgi:hypothetical protein
MKRKFAMAAAVAAAVVLAVGLSVASAGSTGTTLHLVGKKLSALTPSAVRQGALFVQTESISGDSSGRDGVSCTLTTKQGQALCQFAIALKDGQIVSFGLVQLGTPGFDVAVTGGTGKFKDAHGTISIKNTSDTRTDYTVNLG